MEKLKERERKIVRDQKKMDTTKETKLCRRYSENEERKKDIDTEHYK